MCDENTQKDVENYLRRQGHISRRQFGALSAGAGLLAMLPEVSNVRQISCFVPGATCTLARQSCQQ